MMDGLKCRPFFAYLHQIFLQINVAISYKRYKHVIHEKKSILEITIEMYEVHGLPTKDESVKTTQNYKKI